MRYLLFISLAFAFQSCALTPKEAADFSDRITIGIGAFEGLVSQVGAISKVTAELSGASKSTIDRIDSVQAKVSEASALTKESLAAFKASIESAPKKPDGTVDYTAWGTAGVAVLGTIAAYLENLRRKAATAASNHDDNYEAIKAQEKQVAALMAMIEAKVGPVPAAAKV